LKSTDQLDKALEDLYESGKKAQWKLPNEVGINLNTSTNSNSSTNSSNSNSSSTDKTESK